MDLVAFILFVLVYGWPSQFFLLTKTSSVGDIGLGAINSVAFYSVFFFITAALVVPWGLIARLGDDARAKGYQSGCKTLLDGMKSLEQTARDIATDNNWPLAKYKLQTPAPPTNTLSYDLMTSEGQLETLNNRLKGLQQPPAGDEAAVLANELAELFRTIARRSDALVTGASLLVDDLRREILTKNAQLSDAVSQPGSLVMNLIQAAADRVATINGIPGLPSDWRGCLRSQRADRRPLARDSMWQRPPVEEEDDNSLRQQWSWLERTDQRLKLLRDELQKTDKDVSAFNAEANKLAESLKLNLYDNNDLKDFPKQCDIHSNEQVQVFLKPLIGGTGVQALESVKDAKVPVDMRLLVEAQKVKDSGMVDKAKKERDWFFTHYERYLQEKPRGFTELDSFAPVFIHIEGDRERFLEYCRALGLTKMQGR